MESITVRLVVGEDRRIVIELSSDAPTGPMEVTVRPLTDADFLSRSDARRRIQAKLRTAGILNTIHSAPADASPLSSDDRIRLGRMFHEPDAEKRGLY